MVVVCGKIVITLKYCQIGTKIGVVVDMDTMIMIVETKRQKDKMAKRQNGNMAKMQKGKKTKRQKGKQIFLRQKD